MGSKMRNNNNILSAIKSEVHLHIFSKVLKRAGCGSAIYFGITRDPSCIFYNLILLMQDLFKSLLILFL